MDGVYEHRFGGGTVAALDMEAHPGLDARCHLDFRLAVCALQVIVGEALIIIKGKAAINIRGQQEFIASHLILAQIHQLILRYGDNAPCPQEHGDAAQSYRHLDFLSSFISFPAVVVVEAAAFGQVNLAGLSSLFHHIGHQQGVAEHEVYPFPVSALILLEGHEHRRHNGQPLFMGPGHQGVEIGEQLVAQADGLADVFRLVRIHPGFRHGVVRIGGMNGEPGHENTVLHPAHKELRLRRRAVEASHIAALIGHSRKAHSQHGGDIVLQRLPAGQIITGPHLGIALNARMAGAADREGAKLWVVLRDGLIGQLAHEIAHDRLQIADGAALALVVYTAVLVHHGVILAVVIPDGFAAVLQQIILDVLLPCLAGAVPGEIHEHALAAPPGADARLLTVRGPHEHALLLHFRKLGVYQEHPRLDIGGNHNAPLLHGRKPGGRVLEPVLVPGEGAALDALRCFHRAVAGGKLHPVHRDFFFLGGVDKFQNSIIAVLGQFRVVHGAAQIAQGRFGQHHALARKIRIALNDTADFRPRNQEKVNIPCVGTVGGIAVPVVALLPAQVEVTFRSIVIEIPYCPMGAAGKLDIEGDMLIQGIRFHGIVAHGISGSHVQELLRLVDVAAFFPEAVEMVIRLNAAGMQAAAVTVLPVGEIGNILVEQIPLPVIDRQEKRLLMHDHLQLPALDYGLCVALCKLGGGALHAAALTRHEGIRPGSPGRHHQAVAGLVKIPVETGPDAQNVVCQKIQAQRNSIGFDFIKILTITYFSGFGTYPHVGSPSVRAHLPRSS